jgi:lipopolysaccharide/colanic/teichoic acid biosynthesis glycosyltransferase
VVDYRTVKRAVDLVVCALVLPLLMPIFLACAVAVRLDSPGPITFGQARTGRDGRRFKMYKFRTMVQNAEELKEELRHLSIVPWPDFKIIDDPRITRVGKILRKTSLDELPQFINVLLGHMTLVGPRPTSFAADTYSLWHTARLEVAPGLTGLWQVEGRNAATFDERLRMDITYIANMRPMFDLKIILKTVPAVLMRKGA